MRIAHALLLAAREIYGALIARTPRDHFGRDVDLLVVMLAVLIGDFEERPLSETKIAHYTGIARGTVQRKLATLIRRGVIERHGLVFQLSQKTKQTTHHVDRVREALLRI